MSDSVFHVILLLLYYLHFDSDSHNQEITGKPHQINLYQEKSKMIYFLTRCPKFASSCFRRCKIITTSLLFDPVLDKE